MNCMFIYNAKVISSGFSKNEVYARKRQVLVPVGCFTTVSLQQQFGFVFIDELKKNSRDLFVWPQLPETGAPG